MSYILWNCRGLGSDMAVSWANKETQTFCGISSETKMKCHILDGIRRRLSFNRGFNVPLVGVAGGGVELMVARVNQDADSFCNKKYYSFSNSMYGRRGVDPCILDLQDSL
ncbi:hypothetical protein ACFX2A_022690 [Malus domestica]